MEYIPAAKITLHLKLGRCLYQHTGFGEFFESKTFEYVALSKKENGYLIKWVQALDYMYGLCPGMEDFETVEELEGECEFQFQGDLPACLEWAAQNYGCKNNLWSLNIIDKYADYVDEGKLG